MKAKYLWISILSIVCLGIVSSVVLAGSPSYSISSLFGQMNKQLVEQEEIPNTTVIASVGAEDITYYEFREYKYNKEFMLKYQNIENTLSDADLLDEIIKEKLVLQHAKQRGISVSSEELAEFMKEQREMLNANPSPEVKELLNQLVEQSGLWKRNTG